MLSGSDQKYSGGLRTRLGKEFVLSMISVANRWSASTTKVAEPKKDVISLLITKVNISQ